MLWTDEVPVGLAGEGGYMPDIVFQVLSQYLLKRMVCFV